MHEGIQHMAKLGKCKALNPLSHKPEETTSLQSLHPKDAPFAHTSNVDVLIVRAKSSRIGFLQKLHRCSHFLLGRDPHETLAHAKPQ